MAKTRQRRRTGLLEPSANGTAKTQPTKTNVDGDASTNNNTTVINVDAKFKTGPQINVPRSTKKEGKLDKPNEINAKQFKQMLRDPTIRLAIDIVIAMLMKFQWSVEGGDDEYNENMLRTLAPRREMMIRSTIHGLLKAGWRAFETVYDVVDGTQYIVGIKALRTDITTPLAYVDTGEFAGVENKAYNQFEEVIIDAEHVIFVNFDDEGVGDLPEPLLKTVEGPFLKWEKSDEGAQRYDAKVAGGFLFGTYPVGVTAYAAMGNAEVDNSIIWNDMAEALVAGGYAGVPIRVDSETGEPIGKDAWSLEHVAAGGGLQPNFVARLKYLDALKMRVFGIPERTATEGQFGTKAEAGEHAEIAIIINVGRLRALVQAINDGPIKAVNIANHGDPEYCKLVIGEIAPDDKVLFGEVFKSLMADPVFGDEVATSIDAKALLRKLNVPTLTEEQIAEKEAEIEAKKQENMLREQEMFGNQDQTDEDDEDESDFPEF